MHKQIIKNDKQSNIHQKFRELITHDRSVESCTFRIIVCTYLCIGHFDARWMVIGYKID